MTTYTTKQAAAVLGISDSRVRQLLIRSHATDKGIPIGTVHGNAWLLIDDDVERLRARTDGRKRSE